MNTVTLFANKLEIRYTFNDKSSYIDAIMRNKTEYEVLYLIEHIAEWLDVKMKLYSEPNVKEGGFSEIISIAGRNPHANSLVLKIAMQVLSEPLGYEEDSKHKALLPMLTDKMRSLSFQIMYKDSSATVSEELLSLANSYSKYEKRKIYFYEALRVYPKITKVTFRELDDKNKNRSGSIEVKRDDFYKYVNRPILSNFNTPLSQLLNKDDQLSLDLFGGDDPAEPF